MRIKVLCTVSLLSTILFVVASSAEQNPQNASANAIDLSRANLAANPLSWRMANALGVALFQAHRYSEAADAFEHAIAIYPISSASETEEQIKEARQAAFKAQQESERKMKEQQEEAKQKMMEQQMLSGMLSMMPMMPGAGAGTMMMSQMGQTMVNMAYTPGEISMSSGGMMSEVETSQVIKARELARLYENLGQARLALWENSAAFDAFRQAYATDASRIDTLFLEASALQRDEDFPNALRFYSRYLVLSPIPKHPVAWLEIAEICRSLGMEKEVQIALSAARKDWDQVVGQAKTPNTDYSFSRILSASGFYKEAIPYMEQWIKNSNSEATRKEWAIELFRAGKLDEAKKIIQAMGSSSSDNGFSTYFLGVIELHQGKIEQAKKTFGSIDNKSSSSGFAAAAYALCGHIDESKEWMEEIENGLASPDKADIDYYRLACVWFANNNLPRAAECVSRSLALQPGFVPASILKEQILKSVAENLKSAQAEADQSAAKGDFASAVKLMNAVLSELPSGELYNTLTIKNMAYIAKMQNPPRLSKEAQPYYLRGQAILKNAQNAQDIKNALIQYQWALRYAPLSPDIHLSLSSVYASLKQYREALFHIQAYMAAIQGTDKVDLAIERYYELQYLLDNEQNEIRKSLPN
ncbi:MAG TPA: hypothetical protein DD381_09260 [Lentisphaeria bacterium]|nr:MAG: hypothetical protein A2X47_13545 [Lentisphaerae bacterium GWF2_38_69]HBM16511.1 hypothetical protein [Lentisphaeria bacterium]